MLRIAHRGASGYEPENTLASFKKALELGVDVIELDVHLTRDNHLIIMHDKTVNRTTNGKGEIVDKTLAELRELDAGKGEKIPTLQEVLDLVNRKVPVSIEMKGKGKAILVADTIKKYVSDKNWKYSDFMVSSFNRQELSLFKRLLPQVKIAVAIVGILLQFNEYKKLNAYSIYMWSKLLRKSVVEKAHRNGLKIVVYTVNDKKEIEKMKAFGVDGIMSNYPDRIK